MSRLRGRRRTKQKNGKWHRQQQWSPRPNEKMENQNLYGHPSYAIFDKMTSECWLGVCSVLCCAWSARRLRNGKRRTVCTRKTLIVGLFMSCSVLSLMYFRSLVVFAFVRVAICHIQHLPASIKYVVALLIFLTFCSIKAWHGGACMVRPKPEIHLAPKLSAKNKAHTHAHCPRRSFQSYLAAALVRDNNAT